MIVVLLVLSVWICYVSTPTADLRQTAETVGINTKRLNKRRHTAHPREKTRVQPCADSRDSRSRHCLSMERFQHQRRLAALDLNTYNFMFIIAGMLLHWRPRSFLRAAAKAIPMTGGGITSVSVVCRYFRGIDRVRLERGFSQTPCLGFKPEYSPLDRRDLLGDPRTVPTVRWRKVGRRSTYLLEAANQLHVNLAWMVQVYNAAEAYRISSIHSDAAADGTDRGQGARPGWLIRRCS